MQEWSKIYCCHAEEEDCALFDPIKHTHTLTFQIGVHIRLFIFREKSPLYDLIRVYTFIRFEANPPYTIFIWYVRLLGWKYQHIPKLSCAKTK